MCINYPLILNFQFGGMKDIIYHPLAFVSESGEICLQKKFFVKRGIEQLSYINKLDIVWRLLHRWYTSKV